MPQYMAASPKPIWHRSWTTTPAAPAAGATRPARNAAKLLGTLICERPGAHPQVSDHEGVLPDYIPGFVHPQQPFEPARGDTHHLKASGVDDEERRQYRRHRGHCDPGCRSSSTVQVLSVSPFWGHFAGTPLEPRRGLDTAPLFRNTPSKVRTATGW